MAKEELDVLIGGASPIMMLVALKSAIDYICRVALLDAAPVLGGSWTPQARFGRIIDNSPHLLYNFNSNIRPLLKEVSRLADVVFRPMRPQPHSDYRGFGSVMEISFSLGARSSVPKMARVPLILARKLASPESLNYYEPEGGLSSLATLTMGALERKGVAVHSNWSLKSVLVDRGLVKVGSTKGYLTAPLFVSSARLLPMIETSKQHGENSFSRKRYAQAYILVKAQHQKFSYYRPFRDPLVFLAADLTASASPPLLDGQRILSINLKNGLDVKGITNNRVLEFLRRHQLIERSESIISVKWEVIEIIDIPKDVIESRNHRNPHVHYIHCDNLVRTMHEYLKGSRLKKILQATRP